MSEKKPLVTLCLTSYNRKDKLKNCIESFFMTNQYPVEKIEVVIVDNGSDDNETKAYIEDLKIDCFDLKKHFNKKNDYPYCLRRAKNQARDIASGEYFIDCPDDHLFVVKSNWISDYIDYIENEKEKISCVCHYAYPDYRFYKPNNKMKNSEVNMSFFVSQLKGYADYHIMKKETYDFIGKFREDLEFTPNAESEYMDRSYSLGFRRSMPLIPVSIINENNLKLKRPLLVKDLSGFLNLNTLNRPVSNEVLTSICKKLNCVI